MNRIALKVAASGLVLGATCVTGLTPGFGTEPASAFQSPRANGAAGQLHERAARAIAEGRLAEAIGMLEQAVSLSPRDAGYRLLLADAYMKSGRFQSAQATYRDVTELDPNQIRAGIALSLMQVANGQAEAALAGLERLESAASPADLGLAYAVAGAPQRAIDLLEPAARAVGATPRVRQNLALAYAFSGDWQRARTIAAQDVSPTDLPARMTQWASFANRAGTPDPVAALLGVAPAADSGQPVQIALAAPTPIAEEQDPVAFAAVEPSVAPSATSNAVSPAPVVFAETVPMPTDSNATIQAVAEPPVVAPVAFAAVEPETVEAPAPVVAAPAAVEYAELEAPEWGVDEQGSVELPVEEPEAEQVPVQVRYAVAAENLVRADPVVMRVASRAAHAVSPVAVRASVTGRLPGKRATNGEFVVQIGAFGSAANAERAWQHYQDQYGLRAEQPVTMTLDHQGRLLHRVAVSGFAKRTDASQACRAIEARGGECFVRSNAGDAAINWAARYAGADTGNG
jgi:D-alanyl-D-alanine carboxypeptidase